MSVCVYILYVLCIPMCVWMCTQAAQCSSYLTTRRINKEGALVFCRPVVRFNVLCRVLFLKSIRAAVQIFLAVECTSGSVPWFDGVSFVRTICTLLSTVRVCVCVCVCVFVSAAPIFVWHAYRRGHTTDTNSRVWYFQFTRLNVSLTELAPSDAERSSALCKVPDTHISPSLPFSLFLSHPTAPPSNPVLILRDISEV